MPHTVWAGPMVIMVQQPQSSHHTACLGQNETFTSRVPALGFGLHFIARISTNHRLAPINDQMPPSDTFQQR
jgi:hypothetical protein